MNNTPSDLPFHPCINEAAHHIVPRIHLPVAPKCNLSCAFCTRDIGPQTQNQESPGKTESILTPAQALQKAKSFVRAWGQESVIGIAGPGDPLANPETIETLRMVRRALPESQLCICTNGLALPEMIPALKDLKLNHLSVTVNGVDPDIVAQIQPWILVNGETEDGRAGAEKLIAAQLSGIRMAAEAGIFIKINSVVIPGINDAHIHEIATEVADSGAGILNPIPLIPGGRLAHIPRPGPGFMKQIHASCKPIITTFKSCRQCRADAAGIPGKEVLTCQNIA